MRRNIGARLALLLIPLGALLSMVLYAWSTGFISVSCDEFSKTVIASRGLSHPSEWFGGIWLPVHFVLIAGTSLVTGDLLLAARLVSIAFGVLLILALFGIGHQFGGNLGGALAATVGATHPLVVLLSATAMVDICYVAMLMMGLRFLLRVHHFSVHNSIDPFVACGSLTLACAFHYNAWIAVLVLAPFLARSLYRAEMRPIIVVGCLLLLGSVPCAWVVWNWVHTGKPLAFFSNHSDVQCATLVSVGLACFAADSRRRALQFLDRVFATRRHPGILIDGNPREGAYRRPKAICSIGASGWFPDRSLFSLFDGTADLPPSNHGTYSCLPY